MSGLWRTERGRFLAAEMGDLQLVVEMTGAGSARFVVIRPGVGGRPDILLRTGVERDVRAAMAAAERGGRPNLFLCPG